MSSPEMEQVMRSLINSVVVVFGVTMLGACCLPAPKKETAKQYTRTELKQMFVGKTTEELKEKLGTPYKTSETADGNLVGWIYESVSVDPVTNKTDNFTTFWYDKKAGKIVEIDFY